MIGFKKVSALQEYDMAERNCKNMIWQKPAEKMIGLKKVSALHEYDMAERNCKNMIRQKPTVNWNVISSSAFEEYDTAEMQR